MGRKADPIGAVLTYFETASLDAAELMLAHARAVMVRRRGTLARPKKVRVQLGEAAPYVPPPVEKQEQAAPLQVHTAKAPRTRKPKDVALPGIAGPGPISQVGE